jgi:hypothetical protein
MSRSEVCAGVEAQGIVKQRATALCWQFDGQSFLDGMNKIELDEMADQTPIPSLCKIGYERKTGLPPGPVTSLARLDQCSRPRPKTSCIA